MIALNIRTVCVQMNLHIAMDFTEYIVSSRLAGKKLAGTYIFSQLFGKDLYQHGLFMDWIE